jgi:hypothetical protein
MQLQAAPVQMIDGELKKEFEKIKSALRSDNGRVELPISSSRRIRADGYEVVDPQTAAIISGGYDIPILFPESRERPQEGVSLYRNEGELYLARTDQNDRLLASTVQFIGDIRSILLVLALISVLVSVVAHGIASVFLKRYLALRQVRLPSIDEALRTGEGPAIEFKRSVSFEIENSVSQFLQTATAFANSGDGAIFIGVEDDGKIKGVDARSVKEKDRLTDRIHRVVRERIRPAPPISVHYVELRELMVCVVVVARGDERLYFLDGVVYIRDGASDLKARPEIVNKLLAEFAI